MRSSGWNPEWNTSTGCYAFAFRTDGGCLDFLLISVHLAPDPGPASREARRQEIRAIAEWVKRHGGTEKDIFIVGDMNIHHSRELKDFLPAGWVSLNDECRDTSTNRQGSKPYDHLLYRPGSGAAALDQDFDCRGLDLREAMRPYWKGTDPYPGTVSAYDHDRFRTLYSDHQPLEFRLRIPAADRD